MKHQRTKLSLTAFVAVGFLSLANIFALAAEKREGEKRGG
jgi:hypothetical protein